MITYNLENNEIFRLLNDDYFSWIFHQLVCSFPSKISKSIEMRAILSMKANKFKKQLINSRDKREQSTEQIQSSSYKYIYYPRVARAILEIDIERRKKKKKLATSAFISLRCRMAAIYS